MSGELRHLDDLLALSGEGDARQRIPTPALVCDLDLLMGNIALMADATSSAGYALRPHVKSHKSAFVARRQLERGAAGLSCAKLGEAEVVVDRLVADGYGERVSVLVTSPMVGRACAQRAVALAGRCDLIVVADHPDGVDELAEAVSATASPPEATVTVLCDVDVGLGRTGVVGSSGALALAGRVERSRGLRFGGVQGYGGHLQHISGRDRRRADTAEAAHRLDSVIDALESAGHEVGLRTGGGTGTSSIDMEVGVLNELQPGSYVFMDREYAEALRGDPEGRFRQSLTILTTVVSANQGAFVTVDAGLKAMATDAGPPLVVGHETRAEYAFFGDEHGMVTNPAAAPFRRGERLELVPPHCDPTVDRYDVVWLVRDDTVVGIADVVARGCSQ